MTGISDRTDFVQRLVTQVVNSDGSTYSDFEIALTVVTSHRSNISDSVWVFSAIDLLTKGKGMNEAQLREFCLAFGFPR